MSEVIDAMFERKVQPEEHVIRQGDDGDNFYVIESGVYDVIITKNGDNYTDGPERGQRVLQFDGKGSFGELALMYNMPRAATVSHLHHSFDTCLILTQLQPIMWDASSVRCYRGVFVCFYANVL